MCDKCLDSSGRRGQGCPLGSRSSEGLLSHSHPAAPSAPSASRAPAPLGPGLPPPPLGRSRASSGLCSRFSARPPGCRRSGWSSGWGSDGGCLVAATLSSGTWPAGPSCTPGVRANEQSVGRRAAQTTPGSSPDTHLWMGVLGSPVLPSEGQADRPASRACAPEPSSETWEGWLYESDRTE